MVWTCSLIRPRSRLGSLSAWRGGTGSSAESSEHETWLCSTGVFRLDTQGQGHPNTDTYYYREPFIWHLSLSLSLSREYIFSVTRKSLTALIQAETIHNFRLHCTCDHESCVVVRPTSLVMWRGGGPVARSVARSIGVKALDCSFERLWFNRQFLLSLQSNIPQCELVQSLLLTIIRLRPLNTLPPSSPLLLVSFR